MGGEAEVGRRRFSIVGTCSLGLLVKQRRNRTMISQSGFNKTKQYLLPWLDYLVMQLKLRLTLSNERGKEKLIERDRTTTTSPHR